MKINLKEYVKVTNAVAGDVLQLENGKIFLIITDTDGTDYRTLDLQTNIPSDDYCTSPQSLVDYIEEKFNSKLSRLIKSDRIEVRLINE